MYVHLVCTLDCTPSKQHVRVYMLSLALNMKAVPVNLRTIAPSDAWSKNSYAYPGIASGCFCTPS